jgi:hypothetical protein
MLKLWLVLSFVIIVLVTPVRRNWRDRKDDLGD